MSGRTITIKSSSLRRFICDALSKTGMAPADSEKAASVLATADEFGVSTHGVKLLHGYLSRLNAGGTRVHGKPKILGQGPAWAIVDGDHALGMLIGTYAMQVAIDKAKTAGIAYVGVRHSSHFGAAGYYSLMAAKENLIGITVANDTPSVVAPGAKKAVVGTNPFSYAIPAGKHHPILLDIAISTVAGGKVYQSRMLGKPIPADWIVGLDGKPTTDANLYPDRAFLVPAGGHKGFGLALLIETLSGLLSGAAVTAGIGSWMQIPPTDPSDHGAAFIAIDPGILGSRQQFVDRVDALIDEIHATPAAEGIERIIVPGEREFAAQKRAQVEPLVLAPDVATNVIRAADIAGLSIESYQEN